MRDIDVEYKGFNFYQTHNSDRYRIFDSDGRMVALEWEKPNMTTDEAIMAIERFIRVRDAVNNLTASWYVRGGMRGW